MRFKQGLLALLGAAAVAFGAWADPSVTINSVRQNYPWNNTVEINYTIANTPSGADWYISFSAVAGGSTYKLSPSDLGLTDDPISNGTYTAKWTAPDGISEDSATVTVTLTEGGDDYMIVDLTTGGVTYEKMKSQTASNTKYNTDEYKTTKMVFRKVPAGTYQIGDSTNYSGKNDRHSVTASRDYYIAIFPVTQAQYSYLANESTKSSSTLVKTQVSWNTIRGSAAVDATPTTGIAYNLSHLTSLTFDLPTESMWEIACRAGTLTAYWWGDTWSDTYGTTSQNTAVGRYSANPWGIYDMNGTVIEWCRDSWGDSKNLNTVTDAFGYCETAARYRSLRSGDYNGGISATTARSSNRDSIGAVNAGGSGVYGFRLARF